MRLRRTFPALALLLLAAFLGRADNNPAPVPPPATPIEKAIDFFIDAKIKEANATPAARADDANLIRRLTLDLVGRIPTVAETTAFVESKDPAKVNQLVDRLLASSGYARHQASEFNALLMAGTRGSIREYLVAAFAENRPWDRIFRELILPNESDAKQKQAGEFLRQRVTDLDRTTSDISAAFFGVNISCARCHDHPLVSDWKQDHFFGLKAFLNRTFDNGGFLAEREYGKVKFKTVKGQEKVAGYMFLTGTGLTEAIPDDPPADVQKKEKEQFDNFKKNKQVPPTPKNSGRAKLVEVALQPGQRDFFARSIVNRLWARFNGFGLVQPLDQMHSANPPTHPELLEWLANDLIEHGYDLKRLIRGIVLSQTYARSSRWDKGDAPSRDLFAVARVRPLTPSQLATALRLATTDPATLGADLKSDELEKKLEGLEASAAGFASLIEQPSENFQISVSEALLFSNGDRIQKEFLLDSGDRLIGRLKGIADPKELIELAIRTTLSRKPTDDEVRVMTEYLAKRADRKAEACRQIVWALVTSAEFRFNY
jgi:hypothetical protein